MKSCFIRLHSIQDVKRFIKIVTNLPYDVWIISGPRRVSAKSEMEIFSLNLTKPFEVYSESDSPDLFEKLMPYRMKDDSSKGLPKVLR